ncbi:SufD family Fe-S cluster assembly protein [Olsenella sp. YH-ols2217]|uniref:SufD family Fe-S cluster assembly protein n=1 Tax=Kribbibacterium absianum TaxID=3044210 RepID=A0ABT6ZJ68_9ACTN|nr:MULTISPECIES: SufD family Fe-S cluster assembly protein [unclassified Olsenella]MDJ1121072.1 SufD family Fe-S cluster assembly protein [Olsenella sp. YH-ols2216]MDJ1128563.1 SufD family Fe-S cluster assembly protein [Olsenella sp. YH-ols2217]
MSDLRTLQHVNAAPAQTWNWLKINETAVGVPVPADVAAQVDADGWQPLVNTDVPEQAQGVLMGAGTQATGWIDACATQRATVTVPAASYAEEPVLVFLDAAQGTVAQTTVVLEEDASAQVLVCALGRETDAGTTGSALRLVLADGAEAEVDLLVAQGPGQRHVDDLGAALGEDARLTLRQYVLGSEQAAVGVAVELLGRNAALDANLRYVTRAAEATDVSYQSIHEGRKTRTDIVAAGVITGDGSKVLRATIDLAHGCKGAEGSEAETVVLAGDQVVNKTLPVILCSEDDVAGNHGATIGSLSEEQLFYLACRGLTEEDATGLMTTAIVDDAAASLPAEAAAAVVEWARWSLGPDAAESAATAAELAGHDLEEVPA